MNDASKLFYYFLVITIPQQFLILKSNRVIMTLTSQYWKFVSLMV